MVSLRPMTQLSFELFKVASMTGFATLLSEAEDIGLEAALENASQQFQRLVSAGLETSGQFFYDAINESSGRVIGHLWLGIGDRRGLRVASVNDISVNECERGKGFGAQIMALAEAEAKTLGAQRIRIHVFQHNTPALHLYRSLNYQVSSLEMHKDLSAQKPL